MSCVPPQKGHSFTLRQEIRVGKAADAGWYGEEYEEENKLVEGDIQDTLAWQHAVVTMCDHSFRESLHERLRL